jgi:hypothetical protein
MKKSPPPRLPAAIRPERVRYIKLGGAGSWEQECKSKGIIRFGFGSSRPERFRLCRAQQWDELTKFFLEEGKTKGTATRFTNETRLFFDDDGKTLWITFIDDLLFWGFVTPGLPEQHPDNDGVLRHVAGGWRSTDIKGEQLTKDRLSGALTKLAAYRGTSCNVDVADYVVRRINGQKTIEVERAIKALEGVTNSVQEMTKLLQPQDFEILVDLVFSTSGWRRQGEVVPSCWTGWQRI